MTRTVTQLIQAALTEIGVCGMGVPLENEDRDRALDILQAMHDEQEGDRLMLYTVTSKTYTLPASVQDRTIGPTASNPNIDIADERPVWIDTITLTPVGQTLEYEIVPYESRQAWEAEPWKAMTALYPYRYLYEPSYPLGTLHFWPIGTTAPSLKIWYPARLTNPAAPTTSLSLPPGYYRAWTLTLAHRCLRSFRRPPNPELREDARLARNAVKDLNRRGPSTGDFKGVLPTNRGGNFDIERNRTRG